MFVYPQYIELHLLERNTDRTSKVKHVLQIKMLCQQEEFICYIAKANMLEFIWRVRFSNTNLKFKGKPAQILSDPEQLFFQ